jgi:large subunit ribosomal protein L15
MNEVFLNNLVAFNKKKKKTQLGRGNASGHGTYSGRGQKGQKARSGGRGGLRLKALRRIWKKIPKRAGFKSLHEKFRAINLETIDKKFKSEEQVKPETLLAKNLISYSQEKFKILGKKIEQKLNISAYGFSRAAEEAIKKAGGAVNYLVSPKRKAKK